MQTNALRSMAALGCCVLAGCSSMSGGSLLSASEEAAAPPAALGQPTAALVRLGLQTVVQEAKLKPPVQATKLHRGPSSSIDPWLVCMRSNATEASKRQTYAVYFTQEAYARSRLSVLIDGCEKEIYSTFK